MKKMIVILISLLSVCLIHILFADCYTNVITVKNLSSELKKIRLSNSSEAELLLDEMPPYSEEAFKYILEGEAALCVSTDEKENIDQCHGYVMPYYSDDVTIDINKNNYEFIQSPSEENIIIFTLRVLHRHALCKLK